MTKTSNIIMALAAIALMGGCTQEDDQQNAGLTEIRLTTSINQTRATTTQDVQIADDEQVYVWAFKQAASGAAEFATPYIKAWQLEADGAGGLSSGNTTHYYYPTEKLTFVGIHGNFSETLTESSTAMPTTVTHTVESNQNSAANYAKSDLLRWEAYDKATSSSAITAQFSHQLTKIVVVLNSSEYSASELNAATITINGIKRQITLNPQTAALGSASGSATAITPYHTANIHHEAIVPPQDKPDGLITITMNGWSTTLTPSLPASAFAANTKYTYTLDVKKQQVTMTESITQWNDYTAGGSDPVTITDEQGIAPRNVKMNPLWYVAKSNLNQDGNSFSITGSTLQGYLFTWANAMALGYTASTSAYNGYATPTTPKTVYNGESGVCWHIPTEMEWESVVPSGDDDLIFSNAIMAGGSVYTEPACTFGYNNDTKYGAGNTTNPATPTGTQFKSYWSTYVTDSNVRYGIRFLGTDYCSVWKYEMLDLGDLNSSARLIISSRLINVIDEDDTEALSAMMTTITDNDYDWTENESEGAVQRVFYASSHLPASEGTPSDANQRGLNGHFWATTENPEDATKAYRMYFRTNAAGIYLDNLKTHAKSVRLFRDNPEQDVWKNPLWYVAEYNIANSAGTSFSANANSGYFTTWANAMSRFAARTSSYDGYKKANKTVANNNGSASIGTWHLPTKSELLSIFPSISEGIVEGGNIFNNSFGYDENMNTYRPALVTVHFGCNYETKTVGVVDNSFWHKVSDTEIHAIRFLGTPYCSAWKFVKSGGGTSSNPSIITISSTIIDQVEAVEYNAKWFYDNKWSSIVWGNDNTKGAVQRTFYARGYNSSSEGTSPNAYQGTDIAIWCATEYDSNNAWRINSTQITYNLKTVARDIRLFLDN